MFAGFNVTMDDNIILGDFYYDKGQMILKSNKVLIEDNLKKYAYDEEYINGSLMQDDWFPQINADIFISHSHKDEKLVISLAGWLYEMFGLRAFVDSGIWGYADNLLKLIDNKYCVKYQDGINTTYSYEKRNYSTSHVHMMLSMALTKMIDKTECLFFINTPASIAVSDTIKGNTTLSPWIYSELQISEMIRHRKLEEYRPKAEYFEKSATLENAHLLVKYKAQVDHLINLNNRDLLYWWQNGKKNTCKYPLDVLYDCKNLLPKPLNS